jgi:signal transduction histidine kinase
MNGTFSITWNPGGGTQIDVAVPLPGAPMAAP